MKQLCLAVVWITTVALGQSSVSMHFERGSQRWDLSNGSVRAAFELSGKGEFGLRELASPNGGTVWTPPNGMVSSPIRFELDGRLYAEKTAYWLVDHKTEEIAHKGRRLSILLEDTAATVLVRVELELFEGQSVLRYRTVITNLTSKPAYVTAADLMPYQFAAVSDALDVFHIDQWDPTTTTSFQLHRESLPPEGAAISLRTGADARDIAWFAFRDQSKHGVFAGLEFDGRAQVSLFRSASDGSLRLNANVPGIYHPLKPAGTFSSPRAFLGVFQGEWDDAGFATQQFTDAVLAQPAPPDFPWVSWDSWGHDQNINEQILHDSAEAAAKLGIELFVVDLGWARKIGDWRHDPIRFPRGLRPISDYVHQLGMKFGIHFALAESAPDAPVLLDHPTWTASEEEDYFGAVSLCLGNLDTRRWVVNEAVRMIDDYNVDYIVQDGENMVKRCRRTDHTHHPQDSNYSNSVDGLNWVVEEIQRQRPNVLWENCEDGGHMMTFQMVQQYVTSITNDGTGALDSRKGVWGSTFPFPTRYSSRYMPEQPWNTFLTRSYLFGGPWHFMNRLLDMKPAEIDIATREIAIYKQNRSLIRKGRVYHLLGDPAIGNTDAIQSYESDRDAALIVVVRDGSPDERVKLRPQGLRPEGTYRVRFQDDPRIFTFLGQQLLTDGVEVLLPNVQSAEIVYIDPVR